MFQSSLGGSSCRPESLGADLCRANTNLHQAICYCFYQRSRPANIYLWTVKRRSHLSKHGLIYSPSVPGPTCWVRARQGVKYFEGSVRRSQLIEFIAINYIFERARTVKEASGHS